MYQRLDRPISAIHRQRLLLEFTGSADNEPVSATDETRLPPGCFSLRHGFPSWVERGLYEFIGGDLKTAAAEGNLVGSDGGNGSEALESPASSIQTLQTLPDVGPLARAKDGSQQPDLKVPISTILKYVALSFTDVSLLDSLPLDAAGNPGAWHAWRSYRRLPPTPKGYSAASPSSDRAASGIGQRQPGEWNWEGVWEKRVKAGVENSLTDQALFGDARRGVDEMVTKSNRSEA
ncbi:MAG: hypothetical protein Q9160_002243 [Pyrenula sp. 1 TL-2023]